MSEPEINTEQQKKAGEAEARREVANRLSGEEAAEIALQAVDELAEQAGEIERMDKELQEMQNQLMRQAAEFQNYRRRAEQDKQGLLQLGKIQVIQQMLDVLDDLGRSVEAAEQLDAADDPAAAFTALRDGVVLVYRKFLDVMARMGVEPIDAIGQPFDEAVHEALLQQPGPDGEAPGTVLGELQRGYRMGGRVIRHSKVIVAS